MKIINGKKIAAELNKELKTKLGKIKQKYSVTPKLLVILIGNNPASEVYVKNKKLKAEEVGINSSVIRLDDNVSEKRLLEIIFKYNQDKEIDGILVQMPLPPKITSSKVVDAISSEKDVDGFNSKNIGLLALGRPRVIPCTPLGCLKLLQSETNLSGKNVIIIGRSNIVGRPLSLLLTNHNATVTLAHSKTKNLRKVCRDNDILIAATGVPKMIQEDWVNENSIIIDVGINQIKNNEGRNILVGDVNYSDVFKKVKAITPVPGGVGPMTIHCLLENTYKLSILRRNLSIN